MMGLTVGVWGAESELCEQRLRCSDDVEPPLYVRGFRVQLVTEHVPKIWVP